MGNEYRVDRTYGGGYTVRETDAVEGMAVGAAGIAGTLVGASINGLGALARNNRDRKMSQAANEMVSAADTGQFDRLLVLAEAFSRRYPQSSDGPVFLSVALAGVGRYDESLTAVDKAVQLGLDPSTAAMLRIDIYDATGNLAKQLEECTILLQNPETRRDAYMTRTDVLMRIGDFDQALADVNQVISLSPDETAYFVRGMIYQEQGQLQKAVHDYNRANRLDPNSTLTAAILEKRADVYDLLGKTEEAQADRFAVERKRGEVEQEQSALLHEGREFLSYLRSKGVTVEIAGIGRDLALQGKLRRETEDTARRLKPQLLRILEMEQQAQPKQAKNEIDKQPGTIPMSVVRFIHAILAILVALAAFLIITALLLG